jgi:hypothetical protein
MPDLYEVAKAALLEITPESTIGAPSGQLEEAGATSVTFQANMAGYPGWHWTVSIASLDDAEPSVLEVELMPGNGALLAPDWVPWSERLADYEAAQEALAAGEADDELDGAELVSDDEVDDDDDDDDLGSDVLHGGDLDGVDIDEAHEADDDDDEDDSDDESDDDESDDDEDSHSDDDESDDESDDEGYDRAY